MYVCVPIFFSSELTDFSQSYVNMVHTQTCEVETTIVPLNLEH